MKRNYNAIKFGSLSLGDRFYFNKQEYVKTETTDNGFQTNSVRLCNGILFFFADQDEVRNHLQRKIRVSRRASSAAAKVLRNPKTSKAAKTAAGLALTQRLLKKLIGA